MDVKRKISAILLIARWSIAGILAALILGFAISWIVTPRDPNAGDGILILAILVVLIPLGAAAGLTRAAVIWGRRNQP
jgi:hypothetical protein